jgi:hypothetical protein
MLAPLFFFFGLFVCKRRWIFACLQAAGWIVSDFCGNTTSCDFVHVWICHYIVPCYLSVCERKVARVYVSSCHPRVCCVCVCVACHPTPLFPPFPLLSGSDSGVVNGGNSGLTGARGFVTPIPLTEAEIKGFQVRKARGLVTSTDGGRDQRVPGER